MPWTIAPQALLSMEFSIQEYWIGLPCPPPGDLPDPGIKTGFPVLKAESLQSESPGKSTNYIPCMNLALQLFHLSHKVTTASGRIKWLNIKLVYKGRNSGPF